MANAKKPPVGTRLGLRVAEQAGLGPYVAEAPFGEVEIEGALPGEAVEVELQHLGKGRRAYGRVRAVHAASPARRAVSCPNVGECGGCSLLHADLSWQREAKRAWVAEALQLSGDAVEPLIASPDPLGYRALVKLVVGADGQLGSYARRSHRVVDMTGCRVHAEICEGVADRARAFLKSDGRSRGPEGCGLRYLVLRASMSADRLGVTLVGASLEHPGLVRMAEALAADPKVGWIVFHENADLQSDAIFGPGPSRLWLDRFEVVEQVGPVIQDLRSGAFAQVNPKAAARLYQRLGELVDARGRRVLDLYSGSGGIGLSFLAWGAASVTAVERHPLATEAARAAAQTMGLSARFEAIQGAAEDAPFHDAFDLVVLNPPRKGVAPELPARIARSQVKEILYVSCQPRSLARDLAALQTLGGFELRQVCPVDLFPHTRHVETIAWLQR